jgi:hypothetical protein
VSQLTPLSFLALFPVALLAAQQQESSPDATQWRGALGLSIGIPGGFGAQAEVKLLRPVWARGVYAACGALCLGVWVSAFNQSTGRTFGPTSQPQLVRSRAMETGMVFAQASQRRHRERGAPGWGLSFPSPGLGVPGSRLNGGLR